MQAKMAMKKTFPHELIGRIIEIIDSKNPSSIGIKGKIVDETKSTIKVLKEDSRQVTLLKNTITFKIPETGEIIRGEEITKRPEERLKG